MACVWTRTGPGVLRTFLGALSDFHPQAFTSRFSWTHSRPWSEFDATPCARAKATCNPVSLVKQNLPSAYPTQVPRSPRRCRVATTCVIDWRNSSCNKTPLCSHEHPHRVEPSSLFSEWKLSGLLWSASYPWFSAPQSAGLLPTGASSASLLPPRLETDYAFMGLSTALRPVYSLLKTGSIPFDPGGSRGRREPP